MRSRETGPESPARVLPACGIKGSRKRTRACKQEDELVRPGDELQAEAQAQERCIPSACSLAQSGQRAKDQASRGRRERAAPIAVHPLIQRAKLDHCQQAAQQRPRRCGPGRATSSSRARKRPPWRAARPPRRMPKSMRPSRHRKTLPERIDGAIGRLLQHEECFEELVQRMRWIGQTEMPERVGHQQMAEFVVDVGCGNGMVRKQGQPQCDRQCRQQQHAPAGFRRESAQRRARSRARDRARSQNQQRADDELDEVARAEADRIAQRQERAHQIGKMHEGSIFPRRSARRGWYDNADGGTRQPGRFGGSASRGATQSSDHSIVRQFDQGSDGRSDLRRRMCGFRPPG